jgi:dTDP-4-dehydrorhamnose 3,5-epimerase
MKAVSSGLEGVLILEPEVFEDHRGYFMETYQRERYAGLGIDVDFVQDNVSVSSKGTLRGLHFQHPHGQAKLVQVLAGEVYDVAVDVRLGSPRFGRWVGVVLSAANHRQLFIPQGFAHGFCVVSEKAVFHYKCSDFYVPSAEHGILWNDPDLKIDWPQEAPVISEKDAGYNRLMDMPDTSLPAY